MFVCSVQRGIFGDVCFIDFYLSHNTFEDFGTIAVLHPSDIFDFGKSWPVKLAQSGGWMYPIWALATSYPLYLGLIPTGSWQCSLAPCAVLAYGLCIVGGALHSGFAFATVLPTALHYNPEMSSCTQCAQLAQKQIMDTYVFGYTPGPLAVFGASIWIAFIILTRETRFPKWFVLCTPVVTLAWIAAAGAFLSRNPLRSILQDHLERGKPPCFF